MHAVGVECIAGEHRDVGKARLREVLAHGASRAIRSDMILCTVPASMIT